MLHNFWVGCKNGLMKKIIYIFSLVLALVFGARNCSAALDDGLDGSYVGNCEEISVLFARGSGAEVGRSAEYEQLSRAAIEFAHERYMQLAVYDIGYPAVGFSSPFQLLGAYISAGSAYEFGDSVREGVEDVRRSVSEKLQKCPNSKFVLVGYSQGAMVMSHVAAELDSDTIAFLMLIGDPETYLPEGNGFNPPACRTGERSSWRTYAPDCRTYTGVFGGRQPYEISSLAGKYSLWCNRDDYICGSSRNPFRNSGHTAYASKIPLGFRLLAQKYLAPKMRGASNGDLPVELEEFYDSGVPVEDLEARDVEIVRNGGTIQLKWSAPAGARYLLLRLNGYDLGYVDASLGEFEICDIDAARQNDLFVAWMAEDGELGNPKDDSFEAATLDVGDDYVVTESAADIVPIAVPSNHGVGSGLATGVLATISNDIEPIVSNSLPVNDEIIAAVPSNTARGINSVSKASIVKIAFGLMGASGLLIIFIMRKRRGL